MSGFDKAQGKALRARREALGLSLEKVQVETRIPLALLRALEEGRTDRLPESPWLEGYLKAYRARLGLTGEPVSGRKRRPHQRSRVPLWLVRSLALSLALVLVTVSVYQLWRDGVPQPRLGDEAQVVSEPTQHVRLRVRQRGDFQVWVDGEVVQEGLMQAGEQLEVSGHQRVEVHVPAVEAARIVYNGEVILPQGRQDRPRRLVFVDDGSGG